MCTLYEEKLNAKPDTVVTNFLEKHLNLLCFQFSFKNDQKISKKNFQF